MKPFIFLFCCFITTLTAQTELEYIVMRGTCNFTGKDSKKNKNNTTLIKKLDYVLSPITVTKDQYSDDALKKAFEKHLDQKNLLGKITVNSLKKFKTKADAENYAREQLKKDARRTYMTDTILYRLIEDVSKDKPEDKKKKKKSSDGS